MAPLGPFEPAPALAVAVSGGADSLALGLLAARWAAARNGGIVALTVDHRLRPESAEEAATVSRWLAARGLAHRILTLPAPPARRGGLAAAARTARYDCLETWCRDAGIVHLLVAHHAEDQAETVLLRLARGSGIDGWSGMAPVSDRRYCRVLRPLLDVSRQRLRATLVAADQAFLDDPSNRDRRRARARLRDAEPTLAQAGLDPHRLTTIARAAGQARQALDAAADALAAACGTIDRHAGTVRLQLGLLDAAPTGTALRVLAGALASVSGAEHPPRYEALERLRAELRALPRGGRTLGGCRLLPAGPTLLIAREASAMGAPASLVGECFWGECLWDGRVRARRLDAVPPGEALFVGALGRDGIEAVRRAGSGKALDAWPGAVRPTLPAIRDERGLAGLPAIGWWRAGRPLAAVRFAPRRSWRASGFMVV